MEGERNNQDNPTAEAASSGAEGEVREAMNSEHADAPAESTEAGAREPGDAEDTGPRRKRRRRRRKKKDGASEAAPGHDRPNADTSATSSTDSSDAKPSPAPGDPGWQTLAAGLFSHLDERQIPCKVDGCDKTWTWTAQEQMQAFGQPPPRRMCGEHLAKLTAIDDREVECCNPGCERTWTWPKKAQTTQLQRTGSNKPPRKVCPQCTKEERELSDRPAPCRVEGCRRTWVWTRDAQLKHRTWARRQAEEGADTHSRGRGRSGGKRRGRGRRRQTVDINQPPFRMCGPCNDKLSRLVEREVPCKVHGCTRSARMDRESQLRGWAKLRTEDLAAEGPVVRRMCETCREFCHNHPDREVACGRPGCEQTWTYKTGAQLQDSLAGRRQDPIRLCSECSKSGMSGAAVGAPEGMEVLPCVVPLCEGVWFYRAGVTEVAGSGWVELPLDRMCDRCRDERGAESRQPKIDPPAAPAASPVSVEVDGSPVVEEAGAANEPTAANEPIAANGAEPEAIAGTPEPDAVESTGSDLPEETEAAPNESVESVEPESTE